MAFAIRIDREKEQELYRWLREHFNLPAELPLGPSADGSSVTALSVLGIVAIGYGTFKQTRAIIGNDTPTLDQLQATYTAMLVQGEKDLHDSDYAPEHSRRFGKKAHAFVVQHEEAILRIASSIWDLLPEIHRRSTSNEVFADLTPEEFFTSLCLGHGVVMETESEND